MRWFAFVLCLMLPSWAVGQTKVEDLSQREQVAHLIGTCSAFIDYGNKSSEIRQTKLWNKYARDINEIIGLFKGQDYTVEDAKISNAAERDLLAKIITGEIRHTERFYAKCLVDLKNVIKNQYEPNFLWKSD